MTQRQGRGWLPRRRARAGSVGRLVGGWSRDRSSPRTPYLSVAPRRPSSGPRLDDDVGAAVDSPAGLAVLGAERALLAVTHRADAIGRNPERREIGHGRSGP